MRAWKPWGIAIVLAVGSSACRRAPSSKTAVPEPSGPPSQVLRNFELQDIQQGVKTMTLDSDEGHLYDAQQLIQLDKPIVTFYKGVAVSSVLKAPQGQVRMDTHEVTAWGGVMVTAADSSTLTTEHLRYDPKRGKLLSDDPVRLEKPDSLTEGVGLEAEPDLTRVKIGHEKVYVRNQRPADAPS